MMNQIADAAAELLFPEIDVCAVCGRELYDGGDICPVCLAAENGGIYNGMATAGGTDVFACFLYTPLVKRLIHRFKFSGAGWLAAHMGRRMYELAEGCRDADIVCFVPLHIRRRRSRGYDQARLLAERIASMMGKPCLPPIERTRHTKKQSLRHAEARIKNVAGAFRPAKGAEKQAAGKRILLVDDVMTTGATLAECAAALEKAGAAQIKGLVFAVAEGTAN